MSTDKERLEELEAAYRRLWEQHSALKEEIQENYKEFKALRETYGLPQASAAVPQAIKEPVNTVAERAVLQPVNQSAAQESPKAVAPSSAQPAAKSNWEQYIGEQLLSKIGIAILIIGVGIGAKYSIDHNLTTPGMRITGGYVVAAILGFFAFRFREKYNAFSAVLMSGSMAVTYFITYAGFSFYHLYPYSVAFILLLLTTAGTVYSALRYNQVVIAHIGLVGAYILPVLIAQQTAHLSNYLAYMALINGGILFISFLRDWRSLYHVAFGWTSLVLIAWFFTSYHEAGDAYLAMAYATGYFILFHTTVLAYPLLKKRTFHGQDLFLIIPNVLVFLGIGHYILYAADANGHAGFIFGIAITAVFLLLWTFFRITRPEDSLLQQSHLVVGLSVLTLSLIFELEGPQLLFTLVLETCVLIWFGLKSGWKFLNTFCIVLLSLAALCFVVSLGSDWYIREGSPFRNQPFWMIMATVAIAIGTYEAAKRLFPETRQSFSVVNGLLLFFLIGFYLAVTSEIRAAFATPMTTWHVQNATSYIVEYMTLFAFSAAYWLAIVQLNRVYFHFKNEINWLEVFSGVIVFVMLLAVTVLSQGRKIALEQEGLSAIFLFSRYVTLVSVFILLFSWIRKHPGNKLFVTVFHISLLWILSLEMTHWLTVSGNRNAYKLSLSILWAVYAIYILFTGMKKNIAALRVTAMIILGITLVKVFFYDIVRLSTISRIILFIALGGLFLVGAYFYQRYKATEEKAEE